jgi:hypothetical protein
MPKITISRQTTFVECPLRPDGDVDFAAAIDEHCARGVTPENNAAVPLWRAMGPQSFPNPEAKRHFFQRLGIPELPEDGPYLLGILKFAGCREGGTNSPDDSAANRLADQIDRQFEIARRRPWSKEEFPVLAQWLEANEEPLRLVVDASHKPRFYAPIATPGERFLYGSLVSVMTELSDTGRLLLVRAMSRLHAGKTAEAWQDLLVCHRLARLVGQGAFGGDELIARTLENMACDTGAYFAQHVTADAEQMRGFRNDLQRLGPVLHHAASCDFGERLHCISLIVGMARNDRRIIDGFLAGEETYASLKDKKQFEAFLAEEKARYERFKKLVPDPRVNWDQVLRDANDFFDRLVDACRKPTPAERTAALRALGNDLHTVENPSGGADRPVENPSRDLGTCILGALSPWLVGQWQEFAMFARSGLRDLAFALAEYRRDRGRYPAKLKKLVRRYISPLPLDRFSGADFRYRLQGKGYLLYSVGPNGRDDGGRNWGDAIEESKDETDAIPDYDDIAIRTLEERP